MVGIILVAHKRLAEEFISATEEITGGIERIKAISVSAATSSEDIHEKIASTIAELDNGHGVLIITDLFGSTPSNISLSFLEEGRVEVLSGLNMPMLIKLVSTRGEDLKKLAEEMKRYGKDNIYLASEILKSTAERDRDRTDDAL